MGDVLRILNMCVLISFVVSLLSFVLVADLMKKKELRVHCQRGIDFRSLRFDLCIPRITQHVSVVEIVKLKTKMSYFVCATRAERKRSQHLGSTITLS